MKREVSSEFASRGSASHAIYAVVSSNFGDLSDLFFRRQSSDFRSGSKAVTSTSHSPWWDMERHSPWSRNAFAWALAGASVKAGRAPGGALTEARGHSRWQA
jgi:hypothetical protein